MVDKILPGQPLPGGGADKIKGPGSKLPGSPVGAPQQQTGQDTAFRQLLDTQLRTEGGVKFSAHAVRRLESRGISLGPDAVAAVEDAVSRASAKGSRDSLVLSPDYALVVNVPSRTVITAFDQQQLRENVVTNIDSAVFVPQQG
jgi:flagellar operon protein